MPELEPNDAGTDRPRVSVVLVTYNHEAYLAQALDGVLAQEADFAIEILVVEDCSTDSTRAILETYRQLHPDRIQLRLAGRNECSNRAFAEAFLAARGEYVAVLDGDDYWTAPDKLRRQVEYLDANPECALCFHNVLRVFEGTQRPPVPYNPSGQKPLSTLEDLIDSNFIAGCSPVIRRGAVARFPEWYAGAEFGDWALYLIAAHAGKAGYLEPVMGHYRVHSGGVWSRLGLVAQLESLVRFYENLRSWLDPRHVGRIERAAFRRRLQLRVETARLPRDRPLLVMTRGDEALLYFDGRTACHFPCTADRRHRPGDTMTGAELVAAVEGLRRQGAGCLVIPAGAVGARGPEAELMRHLDERYARLVADDVCVIHQLTDIPVIEVMEISLPAFRPEQLVGRNIENPRRGSPVNGHRLVLSGWVLGRTRRAVAVEVTALPETPGVDADFEHGAVLVQRAPVNLRRPDLLAAFPQAIGAEWGGFSTEIALVGLRESCLQVQAVLDDQTRVPLGTVKVRRRCRRLELDAAAAVVSVVIPCYNQAHFLGEAIYSVLAQTYPRFELIVVNDGSADNTMAVAGRYPGVRLINQANQGVAAARNTGFRCSRGSHVVFLDADDRLLPAALEAELARFDARPECGMVHGAPQIIDHDGRLLPSSPEDLEKPEAYLELLKRNYIVFPGAVMYRRAALEAVGGFNVRENPAADYDMYLRIARVMPVGAVATPVAEYRQHGSNMSGDPARMLASTVGVLLAQREQAFSLGPQYRAAWREGLEFWRTLYGGAVVERARRSLAKRDWEAVRHDARILARFHPAGLVVLLGLRRIPTARKTALWL